MGTHIYIYIFIYKLHYLDLYCSSFVAERLSGVIAVHHFAAPLVSSPALLPHPISTGGVCLEIPAVGGGQRRWSCMDSL